MIISISLLHTITGNVGKYNTDIKKTLVPFSYSSDDQPDVTNTVDQMHTRVISVGSRKFTGETYSELFCLQQAYTGWCAGSLTISIRLLL